MRNIGDRNLLHDFIGRADGMVAERHKNYLFNKGEKMIVSLDGQYTSAEIMRLHNMLQSNGFPSVVLGGELGVSMRYVMVTAKPSEWSAAAPAVEEHGKVYFDGERKEYYKVRWEDRGNGDRPVRHYFPCEIGGNSHIAGLVELAADRHNK